ncbi:hypothetical protein BIFDEN_01007 [Bifidobacterium dentium ATCC 27678]|nr:hypothetical protein BIFDEN_01007 [Bifidobacterium dentium ATCC 27678]
MEIANQSENHTNHHAKIRYIFSQVHLTQYFQALPAFLDRPRFRHFNKKPG